MYWEEIYLHFTFTLLSFNPVSEEITHLFFFLQAGVHGTNLCVAHVHST
jgi:hypothetical protein